MSTRIAFTVGRSFRRCRGAIGKSCFKAHWSRSDYQPEKLHTYWSARCFVRSRSSSGWYPAFSFSFAICSQICQNICSAAARFSRSRLLQGPVVEERLEDREVAHVLVGEVLRQVAQLLGLVPGLLVLLRDLLADLPEYLLRGRPVLEVEVAE